MQKQPSLEYLLSVHYLKKMKELGFITYEEYDEIDRLNQITLVRIDKHPRQLNINIVRFTANQMGHKR